jgi:ribosome-associated toxin RatA of RatAB toxin-antitoxin module
LEVRRTALVAHPAERLFALIEAAEDYPLFLPWCAGATILERTDAVVSARLEAAWRGVRFSFVTRNPKRVPTWMEIRLLEGPFRHFHGTWNLTPLADWGCRVEFVLAWEFNAALLGRLAAPLFDHAVNTLVDAFIGRADQLALADRRAAPPAAPPADEPAAPPAALPADLACPATIDPPPVATTDPPPAPTSAGAPPAPAPDSQELPHDPHDRP